MVIVILFILGLLVGLPVMGIAQAASKSSPRKMTPAQYRQHIYHTTGRRRV